MLDIEKALNDDNVKVKLVHTSIDGTTSVEGINEQDIAISVAGAYDHKDAASSGFLQQKISAIFNTIGAGQYQLRNIRDTVSEWCGNPKQPLNISFTILSYNKNINPLSSAKKLLSLASASQKNLVLKAPGNYSPKKLTGTLNFSFKKLDGDFTGSIAEGTWFIEIGKWFRGYNFILTNVSTTHSREIIKSTGFPLFVRINCSFMPYILPTKEIIESWFLL